jgi:hypothetical protein
MGLRGRKDFGFVLALKKVGMSQEKRTRRIRIPE